MTAARRGVPDRLAAIRRLMDGLAAPAPQDKESALKALVILWLDHPWILLSLNLAAILAGGVSFERAGPVIAGIFHNMWPPLRGAAMLQTNLARWKLGRRSHSFDALGMPDDDSGRILAGVFFDILTRREAPGRSIGALGDFRKAIEIVRYALPPLRNAGMVEEANRLDMFWGAVEHRLRSAEDTLILSNGYLLNIGHCVIAAALMETLRSGGFAPRRMAVIPGKTHNPFLQSRLTEAIGAEVPADFRFGEVVDGLKTFTLKDGSRRHVMALLSEAGRVWSQPGRRFMTLDAELVDRGYEALANHGVQRGDRIVTLHVREPGFHARSDAERFHDTQHYGIRNASIEAYGPAIDRVIANGGVVVRLGDPAMTPLGDRPGFVDYPFCEARSDWMDIFLASQCHYHIGTASGMSFVPMLFGRPIAFTNWIMLVNVIDTPNVLTLFKPLFDWRGDLVPFETFATRYPWLGNDKELEFHGVFHAMNTAAEILEAVELMERHAERASGRLALDDAVFEDAQSRFAATPIARRPKIAPGFWSHYYRNA